jgi:hypothetical protein
MFSLGGRFYSVNYQESPITNADKLYIHNDTSVNRSQFYDTGYDSSITFVANPDVGTSKVFKTISYEGSRS